MGMGSFGGRGKEMEEKFFRDRDRELLLALREKEKSKERKKALADASGIDDDQLLDQLAGLDISSETLAALSLIPLIAVAWADGTIDEKERTAVMAAAEQNGMDKEHPGHELLEQWLQQKPDAALLTTWKDYVAAILESLDAAAGNALKEDLLGRARAVAEAAGGLLGFGNKTSKTEQAVLNELEQAFG